MQGHAARDNRSDHQTAHVKHPVQGVPETTIMQEEDIRDHGRLNRLRRSSSNAIEYASAHERAVSHRLGPPDRRRKADDLREDVHGPATEGRADRYPDEVTESEDQDSHACELHNSRQARVEILHVIRKHRRESQRPESLREGDECGSSDAAGLPERRPVQWIIRIRRRLWDQNSRATFDEVVGANICHDLRARENLSVELLLQSVELLCRCQYESTWMLW